MRRQAPARMVRARARDEARRRPQVRVSVRRALRPHGALREFGAQVREFVAESWKTLISVTAAGLLVLAAVVLVPAASMLRKAPVLELAPDQRLESVLLEGILPESEQAEPLPSRVIETLRVAEHTVQAGETLSEIAARYRLKLGTLIDFNGIRDVRKIPAGARLQIPNTDGLKYTVKRNDSLSQIARRYGVSLNALRDWNDLRTDVLQPGQRLFIPGAALSEDQINAVLGKLFVYPTTGELSSPFGYRINPFSGLKTFHNGIDLHNRIGTPVVASRSGRVADVDLSPAYGRYVLVVHSGGFQTMYAHLDTVLVRAGQQVSQGERIATMGNTGQTTGPHLHFTIFQNQVPVDPLKYLH